VHVDPLAVDVVGDEGAADRGVAYPVDDTGTLADDVAEVRLEVDHHEALDAVGTDGLDAGGLAHGASRTVGGEQVAAADLVDLVGSQVADP
jgi:hypothetical protein